MAGHTPWSQIRHKRATRELRFVFDLAGHEPPRLVKVEDERGEPVDVGEWRERPDGRWELVVQFPRES